MCVRILQWNLGAYKSISEEKIPLTFIISDAWFVCSFYVPVYTGSYASVSAGSDSKWEKGTEGHLGDHISHPFVSYSQASFSVSCSVSMNSQGRTKSSHLSYYSCPMQWMRVFFFQGTLHTNSISKHLLGRKCWCFLRHPRWLSGNLN